MDYFKYEYHFNAFHSLDENPQGKHMHSFTIVLYIEAKQSDLFLPFYRVDEVVKGYLSQYEDRYLNEILLFQGKKVTIESMGDLFYEELRAELNAYGLHLLQLEISENPVRVYCISDHLLLATQYGKNNQF